MKIQKFGWGYILLAIVLVALGICFISFNNSFDVLAISFGVITTVSGIAWGVHTLAKRERSLKFAVKIIVCVALIVSGVITMISRKDAVNIMIDILSLLIIIDGSFKLQTSIKSKKYSVAFWWIMLTVAVAVIISAFLVVKITFSKPQNMSIIFGLVTILDGISNFCSAFFYTASENKQAVAIFEEVKDFNNSKNEKLIIKENKKKEKQAKKEKKLNKKDKQIILEDEIKEEEIKEDEIISQPTE